MFCIALTQKICITHVRPKLDPHRNQPINLQYRQIDWFWYEWNIGLVKVCIFAIALMGIL